MVQVTKLPANESVKFLKIRSPHVMKLVMSFCALHVFAQGVFAQFQTASNNGEEGRLTVSNKVFFLSGAAKKDEGFFAFQPFVGNGQISARIERNSKSPLKAGLVLSQSTNLNGSGASRHAGMFLMGSNIVFERLTENKGVPANTIKTNVVGEWLRVVREGNAFSGYHSLDGTNWIQISADTLEVPDRIFAGLVVAGGDAAFSDVQIVTAQMAGLPEKTGMVLPKTFSLRAKVASFGKLPKSVEFFTETDKIGEANEPPYTLNWTNALAGPHSLTAKITDETGAEFFTEPEICEIGLPKAKVTFIGLDEATKGSWKGKYGAEGYAIANDSTNLPPGVQLTMIRCKSNTWEIPATDERSLLRANSPKRIASAWYSGNEANLDLSLADGYQHRIALYFLDWDHQERVTEVQVLDEAGHVLDVQKISNYSNGKYLIWSAVGHVTFRIKVISGGNAVVSALFSDPKP